jgi:hypothetical protein
METEAQIIEKTIAQKIEWDFEANGNFEIRNEDDKLIYFEDSTGYWWSLEVDSQGNEIYASSDDNITDSRPINTTDTNIN